MIEANSDFLWEGLLRELLAEPLAEIAESLELVTLDMRVAPLASYMCIEIPSASFLPRPSSVAVKSYGAVVAHEASQMHTRSRYNNLCINYLNAVYKSCKNNLDCFHIDFSICLRANFKHNQQF